MVIFYQRLNKDLYKLKLMGRGEYKKCYFDDTFVLSTLFK